MSEREDMSEAEHQYWEDRAEEAGLGPKPRELTEMGNHFSREVMLCVSVSEGLFPDERVVTFETTTEGEVSVFAPTSLIEGNRLRVTLLEEDTQLVLVHINGGFTATVKREIIFELVRSAPSGLE